MSSALSIRQLTKIYGNGFQALHGIDLEVAEGDFFALLGPNGAGKSTTIGILSTLVNKTSGSVEVFGHDLDREPYALKRCLGVVPQEFNFNQFEKVLDIVVTQAGYYGIPARLAKERAELYLTQLGLWEKRNAASRELSGGMKRRLMIARALIHQPRLLILDEPTAGVDPQSRNSILDSVAELAAQGMAILYTTHYMEEAERLCDRVGIIDRGRLRAEGTQRELVALVGERDRVTLTGDGDLNGLATRLAELDEVNGAEAADGRVEVFARDARALLPRLLHAAEATGTTVRSVQVVEPDLEAVFLHLTGKALRD